MTNLLQIHINCCRKYRLDTNGLLYLSIIILLFSSILSNSMISSYKTAFFRLSFTVAADFYELVFAARCTAQHECDGEGKCLATCALYNDIRQRDLIVWSAAPCSTPTTHPSYYVFMYNVHYIITTTVCDRREGRIRFGFHTVFKMGEEFGILSIGATGLSRSGLYRFRSLNAV